MVLPTRTSIREEPPHQGVGAIPAGYPDRYRITTQMIRYLEEHTAAYPGVGTVSVVLAQLPDVVRRNPYTHPSARRDLDRLYRHARENEKKVPSLVLLEDGQRRGREYSRLDFQKTLPGSVSTSSDQGVLACAIDDVVIAAFSKKQQTGLGHRLYIAEEGLKGNIYLNPAFFTIFDPCKNIELSSDMRNIAKTFFTVNGANHVALVQYLVPQGNSTEHYHTTDEVIIQLAGRSFLELRPISNDTDVHYAELAPGDFYVTNAQTLHQLRAGDEGSITIPIKQTFEGRKDHLYNIRKSEARIAQEVSEILHRTGYQSGDELLSTLDEYRDGLKSVERGRLRTAIQRILAQERNDNLTGLLTTFERDI